MPLMLQTVRGLSAAQSGLTTFPQALGVILMSQIVRHLYPKIGPRRLLMAGLTIAGLVMLTLLWTSASTNLWDYRIVLFARGMCWAFVFIPLQAAAFATIPFADTGRASALFSTQRQVASSLGIAILITILASQITAAKATVGSTRAVSELPVGHIALPALVGQRRFEADVGGLRALAGLVGDEPPTLERSVDRRD
jgi:fucose permease